MINAAFNGQNVWKAGAKALASFAPTAAFEIGELFQNNSSLSNMNIIGREVLRACAHGLSSGIFAALGGGSFTSGFATGAASSAISSYAQIKNMPTGLMLLTSSAMGGVTAWATGSNFLAGAMQGLNIALYNHGMHKELYRDQYGRLHGHLEEFVFTYKKPSKPLDLFPDVTWEKVADGINTVFSEIGKSLEKNSYNSTIGRKGNKLKFYFHGKGERGFYGNQYVRTMRLSEIGPKITKFTGPIGTAFNIHEAVSGIATDIDDLNRTGHTNLYHTAKAAASITGGIYGAKIGASLGVSIGVWFGGVGSVPGAIIGGAIGGIIGSFWASSAATDAVNYLYGR